MVMVNQSFQIYFFPRQKDPLYQTYWCKVIQETWYVFKQKLLHFESIHTDGKWIRYDDDPYQRRDLLWNCQKYTFIYPLFIIVQIYFKLCHRCRYIVLCKSFVFDLTQLFLFYRFVYLYSFNDGKIEHKLLVYHFLYENSPHNF